MAKTALAESEMTWTGPLQPRVEDIDWELMEALQSDHTLVDLAEIADMCGMANRQSAWLWQRAAQNYLLRGYRQWPPEPSALRMEVSGSPGAPGRYFTHPSILPPPDLPGGRRGQDRWYKGTIYAWGMRTRRITFTGEPIPPTPGPSKGRGPVRGRHQRPRQPAAGETPSE